MLPVRNSDLIVPRRAHRRLNTRPTVPAEHAAAQGVSAGWRIAEFGRHRFQKVQRRARLEPTGNLYALRHTFGSHLAMKGAGPKDIQELLGHTTLTMTMRYIHLTTAHKERAVALLSRRGSDKRASKNGARMALAGTQGNSPEVPAR